MSNEAWEFFHPATGCRRCPVLSAERHTVVWGKGPSPAEVMLIGEAPGYNEDRQGLPFVGMAGRFADSMLLDAGFDPSLLHWGNVVMCRPPGNRDPEPDEILNCSPWLTQHVRDVNPRALILFGRYSISRYFDRETVKDTQGLMYQDQCDDCGGKSGQHFNRRTDLGFWIPLSPDPGGKCSSKMTRRLVAAIYHPASALGGRNPENRPLIVHQLRRVKAELEHFRGENPAWLTTD